MNKRKNKYGIIIEKQHNAAYSKADPSEAPSVGIKCNVMLFFNVPIRLALSKIRHLVRRQKLCPQMID